MRKTIGMLLILVLLLAVLAPISALADDTVYSYGFLLYRVEDGGIVIVGYVGDEETEVYVPNSIGAYPVSVIAAGAFDDAPDVRTVYLPDTIMEIQPGAIPTAIGIVRDYNLDAGSDQNRQGSTVVDNAVQGQIGTVASGGDSAAMSEGTSLEFEEVLDDEEILPPPPTETPAPSPSASPTPAPDASPAAVETKAPEAEETKSASPVGWIAAVAIIVLGGGLWFLLRRKK